MSVHKLAFDNAFFECYPTSFSLRIKQQRRFFYKVDVTSSIPNMRVLSAIKPSSSSWHNCLSQPSFLFLHQVLSKNKLHFISVHNKESIYDAFQQGKSHELSYPKSSVSYRFLELIFCDVGGLLLPLLGETISMYVLLMIVASSLGYISYITNSKFSMGFMISKTWSSVSITKSCPMKQTRVVNQKLNSWFSTWWHFSSCFLSFHS